MIKLYKGDCLELMKEIPDGSIDLILCDLPYGTTACKWDTIIPFEPLWEQYNRIIKDNGAIVLFGSEPFSSKLRMSNLKNYRYDWVWNKKKPTGWLNAKKQPMKQIENISVFYKKQPVYNPQPYKKNTLGYMSNKNKTCYVETLQMKKGRTSLNQNEYGFPRNIIDFIPVLNNLGIDKSGLHPTQKPVALLEYLIKTYTNEGELVLDNCMGSGSTGVACKHTNRRFIGIELDDDYFEIAKKRIEEE